MLKNGFAVSMEILQFEGCRLGRKLYTSVNEFKNQLWMSEASYGQIAHHKESNGSSTETTGSIRNGQFPEICPDTEKAVLDKQEMLTRRWYLLTCRNRQQLTVVERTVQTEVREPTKNAATQRKLSQPSDKVASGSYSTGPGKWMMTED
jgi:hypothetical protein